MYGRSFTRQCPRSRSSISCASHGQQQSHALACRQSYDTWTALIWYVSTYPRLILGGIGLRSQIFKDGCQCQREVLEAWDIQNASLNELRFPLTTMMTKYHSTFYPIDVHDVKYIKLTHLVLNNDPALGQY